MTRPSPTRNTRTERRCPECEGNPETVYYAKAGDPESEVCGTCPHCVDGWIRWAPVDPLDVLADLRRRGYYRSLPSFYRQARAKALGGAPIARLRMVEAAIGCDVACRSAGEAWRAAA